MWNFECHITDYWTHPLNLSKTSKLSSVWNESTVEVWEVEKGEQKRGTTKGQVQVCIVQIWLMSWVGPFILQTDKFLSYE